MTATAESVFENLKKAHPDDSIVVYKFTAPGGCSSFNGACILDINLGGNEWLKAYKFTKSSGPIMNSDEIKSKAFPFVYDTRSITDTNTRRSNLAASLKTVFPNHKVNVFIFSKAWSRDGQCRGASCFQKEYGSDVDILLS